MTLKIFFASTILSNLLLISTTTKAQSPCYLVILGGKGNEGYRLKSTGSSTIGDENKLPKYSVTAFTSMYEREKAFENSLQIKIEIKGEHSRKFREVKLKIGNNRAGCHLLLVRNFKLRPPEYFDAKWISDEAIDEYLFNGHLPRYPQSQDTTIFSKQYQMSIPLPVVEILYKNEPFTAELLKEVNPFYGQNIELNFNITSATGFTAKLKGIEIAFVHPAMTYIPSKYILTRLSLPLPEHDSRFYWPDDFTMIPGAKIIFNCIYWHQDKESAEIIETGKVIKVIEF